MAKEIIHPMIATVHSKKNNEYFWTCSLVSNYQIVLIKTNKHKFFMKKQYLQQKNICYKFFETSSCMICPGQSGGAGCLSKL